MGEAGYIFRMDDASPFMDRANWARLETLFDRYKVKPVVAVVPACADEGLKCEQEDLEFWEKAKAWQSKGWTIALHGFDHVYIGTGSGLVPLNKKTEFADQPEAVQRKKIGDGWRILKEKGLNPTVWIAPSHTFDETTLRCLKEETEIRIVSDGLARTPFRRFGFSWIPQQLWGPKAMPTGTWTFCLHPNTMNPSVPEEVEAFLKKHVQKVVSLSELPVPTRNWGFADRLFEFSFFVVRPLKSKAAHLLKRLGLRK